MLKAQFKALGFAKASGRKQKATLPQQLSYTSLSAPQLSGNHGITANPKPDSVDPQEKAYEKAVARLSLAIRSLLHLNEERHAGLARASVAQRCESNFREGQVATRCCLSDAGVNRLQGLGINFTSGSGRLCSMSFARPSGSQKTAFWHVAWCSTIYIEIYRVTPKPQS